MGQRIDELRARLALLAEAVEEHPVRIIEFIAMSCSRLSPLTTKPSAVAKSSPASCSSIRFRRFTAPP